MASVADGEGAGTSLQALRQRIRDLEAQLQGQGREVRALERIEQLQDRRAALETENRTLREQVGELHTFLTVSKALAATLNLEELCRLALHLVGRCLQVEAYALLLREEGGEQLVVKAAVGLPEASTLGRPLKLGEGIAGLVAQTGQALLIPEMSAEPRFRLPEPGRLPQGACICVPLRLAGPTVLGVLTAQRPAPQGFTLGELDLLQAVANQVAAALENAQLYQRTKELSTRDDLTGLFNRRHFFDSLEQEVQRARRYRRTFALLVLDLDAFKGYNDTYGHLQGDAALKELARLLLTSTRRADIVARFGGEEFVVLLPEITREGALVVAEKIRGAIEGYPFAGRHTQPGGRLTVTLGLAMYPTDAAEGQALLELADRALYLGKQQGGNRACLAPRPHSPEEA